MERNSYYDQITEDMAKRLYQNSYIPDFYPCAWKEREDLGRDHIEVFIFNYRGKLIRHGLCLVQDAYIGNINHFDGSIETLNKSFDEWMRTKLYKIK